MIRFPAHNPKCSVNLFQQNKPHHLMWKCHRGKGQCEITPLLYCLTNPERTADYKCYFTLSICRQLIQFCSKLFRAEHFSIDLQCHNERIRMNLSEDTLALFSFDRFH